MHVTFIPLITVSLTADEWNLVDHGTFQDRRARKEAARCLSETASESLTLAWAVLAGDQRMAVALKIPAHTLEKLPSRVPLDTITTLALNHWQSGVQRFANLGATDASALTTMKSLLDTYLNGAPGIALSLQNLGPGDVMPIVDSKPSVHRRPGV